MLASLSAIAAYREGQEPDSIHNEWLSYIVTAEQTVFNLERIHSFRELDDVNPVLDYVERTLLILDKLDVSFWIREIIEEVLIWSEVAKGGTRRQRKLWQKQGINLFVHNIGSAQLYLEKNRSAARRERFRVIHTLIATHGLIGQQLRGEVPFTENEPLQELMKSGLLSPDELVNILLPLNHCIIAGVSVDLWDSIKDNVEELIGQIAYHTYPGEPVILDRLKLLRTHSIRKGERFNPEIDQIQEHIDLEKQLAPLKQQTLWYVESALQEFSLEEFIKVLLLAVRHGNTGQPVRHISFEKLMNLMYYDYKGTKKINVYKKRIIEKYLLGLSWEMILGGQDIASPHLKHTLQQHPELPDTLFFTFEFSPAAEKLIEFCMEAEKSPLYEKAVLMLFDLFELRRDAYDRFHNEEDYLSDMNQTADYKKVILDYIAGNRAIDIGPGGGVMLDLIELELPHIQATGIDISANVIEALERKKQLEGHTWNVQKGDALNLSSYLNPGQADTIIFSSILHEMYSYIEFEGRRFNHHTIAAALLSAFEILPSGGRIIIRDGIMTEPGTLRRRIRFLEADGLEWLRRYKNDFAGRTIQFEVCGEQEVLMPVNDAMEFLYTYTWGEEAYVHEVQEQFGYFTPGEYADFIRAALGDSALIIENRHFLQEGYTEALQERVLFMDEQGIPVPLPDSTCLIVIEKVKEHG
ncbi:class I SAM-dependent methyltransferase [Paenibacillus sp. YPG26]|uniref:class I SAM-dependent methyltransferase n=1 Tax=Paenibacillus sp. YPG26 TaxID=2878915 RepID=UPI00203C37D5|nr:class I SAM-dependent methyltransferase [Paenibacillus sp. YPG26]USB33995.1 class I SAM-dependent methyltransferase [Paenibacillus sp. YPG26]